MVASQHEIGTRERVLNTARELFNRHGFHQTAMAELAAAAQVSVGQIYRLFKGKEDIIEVIVQENSLEGEKVIAQLYDCLRSGEITIEKAFELLFVQVLHHETEPLSFDILAEGFRNQRVAERVSAMCKGYRRLLRDFACFANPRLSGETLDGAEEVVLACMFGLGHRSLSNPTLSAERTAEKTARMLIVALQGID